MNVSNLKSNVFSALIVFELPVFLFFLQPVLGSHHVLSSYLAIPRGRLHNTGSTRLRALGTFLHSFLSVPE